LAEKVCEGGAFKRKTNRVHLVSVIVIAIIFVAVMALPSSPRLGNYSSKAAKYNHSAVMNCSIQIFMDGNYTSAEDCGTRVTIANSSDSAAVINAAIANLTHGGQIFIRTGTYVLRSVNIFGPSPDDAAVGSSTVDNVKLVGEGNSTILEAGSNLNAGVIGIDDVSGWDIEDLQINGNAVHQSDSGASNPNLTCLWATNGARNTVEHVYMHDCKTYGIEFQGVSQPLIAYNQVQNAYANGIMVNGPGAITSTFVMGAVIIGNTVTQTSDIGIDLSGSWDSAELTTDFTVEGNTIMEANQGISPYDPGNFHGVGIYLGDLGPVSHIALTGNLVDTAYAGIEATSVPVHDVTISGNILYNCEYGIYFEGAGVYGTSIESNVVNGANNGGSGAIFQPPLYGLNFIGNIIENQTGSGYAVYLNVNEAVISGNTFNNTARGLTLVSASNNTVTGNEFNDAAMIGGYISSVSVTGDYNVFSQNVIVVNNPSTESGFAIGGAYNVFTGNIVDGSYQGFYIGVGSVGNEIYGNIVRDSFHPIDDHGMQTTILGNLGYNPQGHLSTPFDDTTNTIVEQSMNSLSTSPNNATTMTDWESPKLISIYVGSGWTSSHTLVLKIDGTTYVSTNSPTANSLLWSGILQPGQSFYIQYQASEATFEVESE
jgi:parallel beta-helix repeat protein